jgi:RNA polymerase sigma-70 factor (ECF subfamily)
MTDDRDLVVAARQGQREAFHALYERHRLAVLRLAEGFGSLDADEVADVVQDCFVHAYTSLGALRSPEQFRPWLLSIARHRCLNHRHGQKLSRKAVEQLGRLSAEPPMLAQAALEQEEDRVLVRELIGSLPEGAEKRTATLFYIEGELSVREIAEQLGENKSAVGMRLERFRARFKQLLLARRDPNAAPHRKAGS